MKIENFKLKIFLTIVIWFFLQPKLAFAVAKYPVPELGNCRNSRECYLYCQIPINTPACWSYGKYIFTLSNVEGLDPNVLPAGRQVLGEIDVNITYPIPELGNCNSAQDCFIYCSQPQNQPACLTFAKNQGLVKEKDSPDDTPPPPEVIEAAKSQLGCSSREACMTVCDQPANFEKCRNFAEKHNLRKGSPTERQRPPVQVLEAARSELGCNSPDSCMSVCNKAENFDRCHAFAKKYNLMREEDRRYEEEREKMIEVKKKMVEDTRAELDCDDLDSCKIVCEKEENREKCASIAKKYDLVPPPRSEMKQLPAGITHFPSQPPIQLPPGLQNRTPTNISQIQGPGGCKTETECKAYCDKHKDECPGFPKTQGQTSTASQNLPQQSPNQPGTEVSSQSQLPQGQSIPTGHQFPPGENQPSQHQSPPNPAGGSPQSSQP